VGFNEFGNMRRGWGTFSFPKGQELLLLLLLRILQQHQMLALRPCSALKARVKRCSCLEVTCSPAALWGQDAPKILAIDVRIDRVYSTAYAAASYNTHTCEALHILRC
jgi:hypothetical protein